MAAVRFCLDYPGINCRQCADNLREDGVEPDCDSQGRLSVAGARDGAGATAGCPVEKWDADTRLAMALYDRCCPWGDLDYMAVKDAFNDLEIPLHKRRLMRRILPAIHREIKKASQPDQPQQS